MNPHWHIMAHAGATPGVTNSNYIPPAIPSNALSNIEAFLGILSFVACDEQELFPSPRDTSRGPFPTRPCRASKVPFQCPPDPSWTWVPRHSGHVVRPSPSDGYNSLVSLFMPFLCTSQVTSSCEGKNSVEIHTSFQEFSAHHGNLGFQLHLAIS